MTFVKLLQLYVKYSPVINITARVIFLCRLYRQVAHNSEHVCKCSLIPSVPLLVQYLIHLRHCWWR